MKNQHLLTFQMIILMVSTFLYMCSISMSNPIMAGLCGQMGGKGAIMGVVSGLSSFVALFFRPFFGDLIDRQDRRKLSLVGSAFMTLGGILCATAPAITLLLLGRFLVGIGLSLCSSTLSTWFAASMPEDRIAQGMGIYGVIQAISMAIAPAFGLWVASVFGYRIACWTAALFNGVCIPLILPLHDEHYIAKADTSSPARQRKRSFLLPQLIPLASIMFLFCVPYNGAVSFLDVFVKSNGLSFSAGIFFSSFAIWLLLTRLFLSRFLDRISFRVFVIIGIPLAVFSMLLLQWTQSIYCLIVSALLLSLSYGILQPVGQATSIKSAPEGKQGVANCTYYIGMDLGMALGPVIAGGVYQVAGASLLFYTMAFFPLLAIPILIIFKKYLVKDNNRNAMENRSISNI